MLAQYVNILPGIISFSFCPSKIVYNNNSFCPSLTNIMHSLMKVTWLLTKKGSGNRSIVFTADSNRLCVRSV